MPEARSFRDAVDGLPPIADRYLESVPLRAPEPLSEDDLAHILALRATYGLSTDPEFVRQMYSDPESLDARRSPTRILSSIAYTPQERGQVARRAAAEWVGYNVDLLAVEHVSNYSATVIESDGSVTIHCAPCSPAEVSRVVSVVDVEEDFVEITSRDVEHSAADLQEIAEQLSEELHARSVPHGLEITSGQNRINLYVALRISRWGDGG